MKDITIGYICPVKNKRAVVPFHEVWISTVEDDWDSYTVITVHTCPLCKQEHRYKN